MHCTWPGDEDGSDWIVSFYSLLNCCADSENTEDTRFVFQCKPSLTKAKAILWTGHPSSSPKRSKKTPLLACFLLYTNHLDTSLKHGLFIMISQVRTNISRTKTGNVGWKITHHFCDKTSIVLRFKLYFLGLDFLYGLGMTHGCY